MSINKIEQALPGERVVALSPEDAASAATGWLRRPNMFAGRALTTFTLEQRQRWQAGRIAQHGQAFTPGVVQGLEVSEPVAPAATSETSARVFIEPGLGLGASGEDVVVARRAEFALSDLPVVAPPYLFTGLLDADAQKAADDSAIDNADPRPGAPLPRAIGPTLGEVLAHAPGSLASIGILVLQPVSVDTADLNADDPCDRCFCDDADTGADPASLEDWRTRDAVRLLWYAWPEDWRPLPFSELRQRNALAHTIFEAEAVLVHGECLPWEQFGVPIALVAIDDTLAVRYIDRAAVVRQGGRAREARLQLAHVGEVRALAASSRLPALWQARIEQFGEQIAEMGEPLPAPEILADPFLHLPPCGLLPAAALRLDDLDNLRSDFFPPLFTLDATPVPLEQLDIAIREAAPMAAFDIGVPERVRLLVPVTQASWESRLLLRDAIDKAFGETLDRFLLDRARALGARQCLRSKAALLAHAMDGQRHAVIAFDEDPFAVEPEVLTPWGPPPDGGGHRSSLQAGLHEHYFDSSSVPFQIDADDFLFLWVYIDPDNPPRALMLQWHTAATGWEQRAYFGEDLIDVGSPDSPSRFQAGELPVSGEWVRLAVRAADVSLEGAKLDGMRFTLYDGRAAFGETGVLSKLEQRNWFSNFIPADARVQGNEQWDLLTNNDLWSPFERDDGVVPSLPEAEVSGGDLLDGEVAPAETGLAIPNSGYSIHYPLHRGWQGHTIAFKDAASAPVFPNSTGSDELSIWVYLDELTPPRAIWGYVACTGLNDSDAAIGGFVIRLGFWGENRLAELNEYIPGIKNYESQTLRAGALPQAGLWTRLTLRQPDGSKMESAKKLRVFAIGLMTFGGSMAFSDIAIETAAAGDAAIPVWPLGEAEDQPTPPFTPYKGSPAKLQTALEVLTPTPSSLIGTVRIYTELANDPLLARLSFHERSQLQLRGLQGFADYLRVRIDRADDITDFGFAHMQVDMHRIRQMMMSTTDASRLAISPALAAIAKSDSALNVQAQIKDYLAGVKSKPAPDATGLAAATAPSAAATATKSTASSGASTAISAAQKIKASTRASLIAAPHAALDIVYARPVIGLSEVRTTAIAERLRQPPSTEARDYALANRQRTVSSLLDLLEAFMSEDSGEVPSLFQDFYIFGLEGDPFLEGDATRKRKLTEFHLDSTLLEKVLQPPSLGDEVDEGGLFTQTTALSDNTVAILRQLEGRLTIYRDALTRCERAQDDLRKEVDALGRRLSEVEDVIAEARHDVGVARALMTEEQARIDAVNARRRKVLDEEVKFLAYVRPRQTSNVLSAPRRVVDPALAEAPVPTCLREHHDVPDELEDMLKVVREAPAGWFMRVPALLDKLDRSDLLLRAMNSARNRMPQLAARKPVSAPAAGKLGDAVFKVLTRQNSVLSARIVAVNKVNFDLLASGSWQNLRNQAKDIVSLGDIIDGEHGKGAVARQAADEFNRISAVCACLHAEFCGVPALIRLGWAETLSQFDDAPNLRNLGSLARWSEIDSTDRRQMQAYADWLFTQLEPGQPQGQALMNDVIRMCLLLASHAPVDRIIVGRLPRPVTGVQPGQRIPLLALDPAKLRIGMLAVLYRANQVVARAVVEDIGSGEASARVVHTSAAKIDLDVDLRVHFDNASVVSAAAARAGGIFRR